MNLPSLRDNDLQAWQRAEIHESGLVIKRLTWGFPHGCMAGISIIKKQSCGLQGCFLVFQNHFFKLTYVATFIRLHLHLHILTYMSTSERRHTILPKLTHMATSKMHKNDRLGRRSIISLFAINRQHKMCYNRLINNKSITTVGEQAQEWG